MLLSRQEELPITFLALESLSQTSFIVSETLPQVPTADSLLIK
jgi:hypothetical protein